jgi:endoglucanase
VLISSAFFAATQFNFNSRQLELLGALAKEAVFIMSGFSLFGVNLSGAEYDPGGTLEGTNYTYPTDAEIDYYASKGMTAIRLPFLLERVEPVGGGPLSTTELGYIDNVVSYAASKGIDVILDPHDFGDEYGTVIGTTAASNATFANFWGELASHFASASNVLFGLMNEPNAVTPAQWLVSANAAIAAIRAAGATTQQILVPGTDWDGADTWISSGNAQVLGSGIVDSSDNFAFEVHQYLDADGSGTSSSVVSTEIGVERLTAITQWAEATGNKLFLGEFGVASDPTSLSALNNMLAYMGEHTDVWEGGTYWAAGAWWGSYMYSVEPADGVDKPQMGVLEQFVPPTSLTATASAGSDVFWYNASTGDVGDWQVYGAIAQWTGIGTASLTMQGAGIGDFTGDATSDILWENPTNGIVGDWLMNNNVPTWQQIGQGSTTMNIAGVGDFYGNGTDDILWQNPTNNAVGEWQMINNTPFWAMIGQGSTTMNIAGIGDFNGDGKSDILWENPTNKLVGMWAMNGSTPTWSLIDQGSTTMTIVGVGDFTASGTDDVLWENRSNGVVGFWEMATGLDTSWIVVATANPAYQVAGIGDYNGDGTSDILWRNPTTGDTGIWVMNNGQATWHDLGSSSTAFNVVKT